MKSIQSVLSMFLLMLLLPINSAIADPTNFNYTQLGFGLGRLNIPDTCIYADCYTGLGTTRIAGGIQFADDLLVVNLQSAVAKNTSQFSSIQENVGALGLSIVHSLGNQVDIEFGINALSSKVELCNTNASLCSTTDDTGHDYFVALYTWIDDGKHFSLGGMVGSGSYSKSTSSSTTTGIGLSFYPTQNHEIALVSQNSTSNGYSTNSIEIQYFYHFNNNSKGTNSYVTTNPSPTVTQPQTTQNNGNTLERLKTLEELKNNNLITDDEYRMKRQQIMNEM